MAAARVFQFGALSRWSHATSSSNQGRIPGESAPLWQVRIVKFQNTKRLVLRSFALTAYNEVRNQCSFTITVTYPGTRGSSRQQESELTGQLSFRMRSMC